jgi:hypothetical protein
VNSALNTEHYRLNTAQHSEHWQGKTSLCTLYTTPWWKLHTCCPNLLLSNPINCVHYVGGVDGVLYNFPILTNNTCYGSYAMVPCVLHCTKVCNSCYKEFCLIFPTTAMSRCDGMVYILLSTLNYFQKCLMKWQAIFIFVHTQLLSWFLEVIEGYTYYCHHKIIVLSARPHSKKNRNFHCGLIKQN